VIALAGHERKPFRLSCWRGLASPRGPQGLASTCWAAILLCLAALTAGAQSPAVDIAQVTVAAQSVSTGGTQPPQMHWVLSTLPAEGDLRIQDPGVRTRFLQTIDRLRRHTPACEHFILDHDPGGGCSFLSSLSGGADGLHFSGPANLLRRPAGAAAPQPFTLRGFWTTGPPPAPVHDLCIAVSIGRFEGLCSTPDPSTTTVTLGELAPSLGLGQMPPQYRNIRIRTKALKSSSAVTAQLQAVAVNAFLAARKLDMLPAPPAAEKPPLHTQELEDAIAKIYGIEDSGWPEPRVTFGPVTAGGGDYRLLIENLLIVDSATVVLTRGPDVATLDPPTEKALNARLDRARSQVEKRFGPLLDSLKGEIPTNEGAWKIARAIGMSNQVTGVVIPKSAAGNRIEFTGEHRWVIGGLTATADAGISGSPHQILGGTAQFDANHLLLPLSHTFADTASLTLNAGPEVQRADFSFGIGGTAGSGQVVDYGLAVDGVYSRDRNQRFGYVAGPKFVD
jgi:hypothetical protein